MPTLAIIDGIQILMYLNDHGEPHFYIRHGSIRAKIEIATGRQMKGDLSRSALRKVQLWTELNRDLLFKAWTDCQSRS